MNKILVRLLVAYAVPTLILFTLFGIYAHELLRRDLDGALGARLTSVAEIAAARIRGQFLVETPDPTAAVAYTRKELETLGADRVIVFDAQHRSLVDTDPGVPYGTVVHELDLDRHELDSVFAGQPAASVLFKGRDGRRYKAGYAPVTRSERDHTVVAALRVEAPAAYFGELDALTRRLLLLGALLAAVVVLASFLVAALLTRPLRLLAGAATRIGGGDLAAPVPHRGSDEIARLAATLDDMRERLRARDERLQMMLAGIAHEVRNPLGGMELFAGILRDELTGDPEKLGHVKKIEKELGHLKTVVGEFLEFARRPRPELSRVDVGALLDELAELSRADAESARVVFHVERPPAPVYARADATQLRRALLNLVANAVQATPAGGAVTLSGIPDGDHVVIRVTDTGRGVPADELDKIFTPFYTTREKGTGLGLAFVKEIVADHQGTLHVDSKVGEGTTFTIEVRAWASS